MDIEAILKDKVSRVEAENRPPFESSFDYSNFLQLKKEALAEWKEIGSAGQAAYKDNLRKFYEEKGLLPSGLPQLRI